MYLYIHMLPHLLLLCFLLPTPLFPYYHLAKLPKQMIMWPRMVANKLLRRPLASNNFVADFPNTETILEEPCSDHPTYDDRYRDQREIHKYKLFASTYNVGGVAPSDDLKLEDWLDTKNSSYDIYVLGFQEIVPLNAINVLGSENNKISTKWNSLIRAALNHTVRRSQEPNSGENQKVYPSNEGSSSTKQSGYRCIVSKQMVGIAVSVWVRTSLVHSVRHTSVSCVGCGLMGCLGNKGSVSVRFFLYDTSFCIVCCHLASGGKKGDEMHRNMDAMEIFSRTSFPSSYTTLPQKILDHDRIILLGDLNYRISLPEAETRMLVKQKEWKMLLEKDQLRGEVNDGRAFEGWHEGTIEFTPTYKYFPNSDEYYGCMQNKKGLKKRPPAWCDRILYRGNGLKQISYDRSEYKLSDHRPVQAVFVVEVETPKMNSLRSFFLSDRFDNVPTDLDLSGKVDISLQRILVRKMILPSNNVPTPYPNTHNGMV